MFDFEEKIDRRGTGSAKWAHAPEAVKLAGEIPLSVADMELRCPKAVTEALHKAADHGIYGYTIADEEYFSATRDYLKRRHGYEVEREWMLNTHGIVPAVGLAVRALTEAGDAVLVCPPVYYPFYSAIEKNGRKIYRSQLLLKNGKYEMNFPEFEDLCARDEVKLFIMSSPHNPVGRVWSAEELREIARICKENNVFVIADEIHCDIILPGNRHTSFITVPDGRDNCMLCTAISKTFNLAGLNCSDIFIPNAEARAKIAKKLDDEGAFGIGYFSRAASIAAHTECDDWLDAMILHVNGNFELMYKFIKERLPELSCIRAEGTYLAWVDMRALGLSNEEQERMDVEDAKLALDEGYVFGMGGEGFSRWNLAAPRAEILRALERFEKAINALQKKRGLR